MTRRARDPRPTCAPALATAGQARVIALLPWFADRLVTANRALLSGPLSRLLWLKLTVTSVFCLGIAMSWRLWIGSRSFPAAPVSDLLPALPHPADVLLFAGLFVAAGAILFSPKPQKFIWAFLALIAALCLFDQTRWQPWVYQYGALLAALALFSWDSADTAGRNRALNIARLIVATTYIFSGLQKVNANFIGNDFPWIVEPLTNLIPSSRIPLQALGMAAPFVQIAFGIGLLTRRYRGISLALAVSMHVFILAMFGPLGHDWNVIIWPWTATMAMLDLLLFTRGQEFSAGEIFRTDRHPYHVCVLVLFALLPFLSFFNLWDSYPSSALYSGNLTEALVYTTDAGRDSLPASIGARFVHTSADTNVLNLQRWAMEELNVFPYPETRVYRRIAKAVCGQARLPDQLVLLVHEQRMFGSRPETGYRCRDL
jgi:hypothetical protein